ncbi:MAG: MBG domain-containing protein [Terriglobales bacterium]
MSRRNVWLCACLLLPCCVLSMLAQQPAGASTGSTAVAPPLVSFSGVLTDDHGKALTGVVGVTFALYKDAEGGAPLWLETQNVYPDKTGHYTVVLGSTTSTGIPGDIFVAGEARWLGIQAQGQPEQPRVPNVTLPRLTVIANSATRIYGAANPAFSYTLDGGTATGAPAISTTADAYYPWGNYPIKISRGKLTAPNYTFFFVPGTLFITQAPLTVTANNQTIAQGQPVPALSYTVTGFVNGQNSSVLSGSASISTTATSSSPPGTYPITVTQGSLWTENYNFTFVNGTLTITSAQ